MMRRKRKASWLPTLSATGWGESTFAEQAWGEERGAALRWAVAGALVGTIVALIAFAPASWLARVVAANTAQRLLLTDARGTIWSGSAVPMLTGGAGSRDASALPGRLEWTLGLHGLALELQLSQACCLNGNVTLRLRPGFGRITTTLLPSAGWVGQWPSAWLGGLGTPWNTMQLGGTVRVVSPGLALENVQGRWRLDGRVDVELLDVSSRLSTLQPLGSYRLTVAGSPSDSAGTRLTLSTQDGALQLLGSGTWGATGVRFRGEARAANSDEAALNNLLNIIGRRDGARSIISIG